MLKHVADAETKFVVVNVNPDFCKVDGKVVAFDISRDVSKEKTSYAQDLFARGEKVLPVGSVVKGVEGNAGEGILGSGCRKGRQRDDDRFAGALRQWARRVPAQR